MRKPDRRGGCRQWAVSRGKKGKGQKEKAKAVENEVSSFEFRVQNNTQITQKRNRLHPRRCGRGRPRSSVAISADEDVRAPGAVVSGQAGQARLQKMTRFPEHSTEDLD